MTKVAEAVEELAATTAAAEAKLLAEDVEPEPEPLELHADVVQAVNELRYIRSEKSALLKREAELRATIFDALSEAGATAGVTRAGRRIVYLQNQTRRVVDRKRLEAMHPEIYQECTIETPVQIMRVEDEE